MSSTGQNQAFYTSKTGKHPILKRQNAFTMGSSRISNKSRTILKRHNAMVISKPLRGPCYVCDLPNCELVGSNFACDNLFCGQDMHIEQEEEDYDW